jgi:hypothetical protein
MLGMLDYPSLGNRSTCPNIRSGCSICIAVHIHNCAHLIHGTVEFQPVLARAARAERVHRGLGERPLQSQVALWQCQSPCRGRVA